MKPHRHAEEAARLARERLSSEEVQALHKNRNRAEDRARRQKALREWVQADGEQDSSGQRSKLWLWGGTLAAAATVVLLIRFLGPTESQSSADELRDILAAITSEQELTEKQTEQMERLLGDPQARAALLRPPHRKASWDAISPDILRSPGPVLRSPRATITDTSPLFELTSRAQPTEQRFLIQLSGTDLETVEFTLTIPPNKARGTVPLPSEVSLQPGKQYRWDAVPEGENQAQPTPAKLQVLSEQQVQGLLSLPTGNRTLDAILRATVFNAHGLATLTLEELPRGLLSPDRKLDATERSFVRFLRAEAHALLEDVEAFVTAREDAVLL
jgi:hypothetical protein